MLPSNIKQLALKAGIALIILAVVWPFVAATHARLLAAVAEVVTGDIASITATGWRLMIQPQDTTAQASVSIHNFTLQSGVLLIAAVVVTTPGWNIPKRIVGLGITLTLALLVQGAVLGIFARQYTEALADESARNSLLAGLTAFWSMLPLIVAGLWCLWRWRPLLPLARTSTNGADYRPIPQGETG